MELENSCKALLVSGLFFLFFNIIIIIVFFSNKINRSNVEIFVVLIGEILNFKSQFRQKRKLRKQGITGPSPSLLCGNMAEMQRIIRASTVSKGTPPPVIDGSDRVSVAHDYTSAVFPYFQHWAETYGLVYTYSTGDRQHLYINDPKLVKEMSQSMSLHLGKPSHITKALAPMLGNGIIRSNGIPWAHHRKILSPAFFMDKVKAMTGMMMDATQRLVEKWEAEIEEKGGESADVRVDDDLSNLTADMISRACFGSSYSKGKEIFSKLRALQRLISKQGFLFKVPIFRFFNSKAQEEIKSLEKEVEQLIWNSVQERVQTSNSNHHDMNGKDLMQLMLDGAIDGHDREAAGRSWESTEQFLVDNCKNIYFAGHHSTAVASSWCVMLLALYPDWQRRIRDELAEHSNDGCLPDSDAILKIKSATMVIQEALRLYTPAAFVSREALEDIKVGDLEVPKGVCIWTLIPALHRDPNIWGPDANEFKPERFANGVTSACSVPQAYVPFGLGPRLCVAKNFAMMELKTILCLVVSKFSFELSPLYKHSPKYKLMIEPDDGVRIIIRKNESM
ncbi:hypothetical protein V2J09_012131 [Rumex salicifolius]